MKKLIVIPFILSFFFSFGQTVINRALPVNTVQDGRLMAQYNMFLPRFRDTTAANFSKGIDSAGAIIFTYDSNFLWKRNSNPKKWEKVGTGSGAAQAGFINLRTIVGRDSGPAPGDSVFTYSGFANKKVDVYREGEYQYDSVDVFVDSITGTFTFRPALWEGERLLFRAYNNVTMQYRYLNDAIRPELGTPFISEAEPNYIQLPYDVALRSSSVPTAGKFTSNGTFKPLGELLTVNPDQVPGNDTTLTRTGTADFGDETSDFAWINEGSRSRCRQNGRIVKIQFYMTSKPSELTHLYFYIWRRNGGNYTLISRQDILSSVTGAAYNSVTLATPITVKEGDYTGWGYTGTGTPSSAFFISTPSVGGGAYDGAYYQTSNPTISTNWEGQAHVDLYFPTRIIMEEAPLMAAWGNSIVAGYGSFLGYVQGWSSIVPQSESVSISWKLANKLGSVGIHNLGWSGQVLDEIKARLISDLPVIKPRYALLEGGNNDGGSLASVMITKWDAMLQACVDNGVVPIIIPILPSSSKSDAVMRSFDSVNTHLSAVASSYGAIYCGSVFAAVGEFRSGGTAGNLWNIQAAFQYDANHYNGNGNEAIATALLSDISAAMPVIVSGNTVKVKYLRNFTASDDVIVSYSGTEIKSNSTGTSAATFTNVPVANNITPGIEDLNFSVVYQWTSDGEGEWYGELPSGGGAGLADKRIAAGEVGWAGAYLQLSNTGFFGFSPDADRVSHYNGADLYAAQKMGFAFQGDGGIIKIENYGNAGTTAGTWVVGRLYAIHKTLSGGVAHYNLKYSTDDGATWTQIYNYDGVTTADVDMYIYGSQAGASHPKGFGISGF